MGNLTGILDQVEPSKVWPSLKDVTPVATPTKLVEAWQALPTDADGAISQDKARELYLSRAYDHANPKPPAEAIYKLAGVTIATPGNVVAATAQQGTGKSSFVAAGLAAPMGDGDCLGLESENPAGHAVIHIDTEQSAEDFDTLVRFKALRRAGVDSPPEWLMSTHLTGCTPAEIVAALETMLEDAIMEHGGVHSVWLDGIADAVSSPNDEEESVGIVRRVHGLAIQYACPILCILHLNPGSDFKSRGHLGSQLERKAETVLQLRKAEEDGRDVTTVFATKTRHKPIPEHLAPRFSWSDEHGMHMSVETKAAARKSAKEAELLELAFGVWGKEPGMDLSYREVVNRILAYSESERLGRGGRGFGQRTAEEKLTQLTNCAGVEKSLLQGHYRLTASAIGELRRRMA